MKKWLGKIAMIVLSQMSKMVKTGQTGGGNFNFLYQVMAADVNISDVNNPFSSATSAAVQMAANAINTSNSTLGAHFSDTVIHNIALDSSGSAAAGGKPIHTGAATGAGV